MRVQSTAPGSVDACNAPRTMLRSAPASSGGEPSKTRRSGTRARSRIRPGSAVRQCGAGRDDDVDSAASVCPGHGARAPARRLPGRFPAPGPRPTAA